MFGSQILEVAVGLVLVYLVLSLVASSVREGIESFLKSRAVQLERGIREMLHDPDGHGFAKRVFEHPLIFGLYRGGYTPSPSEKDRIKERIKGWTPNLPSYIPARSFANAVLDIAARGDRGLEVALDGAPSLAEIRKTLLAMEGVPSPVRHALVHAIDTAGGSLDRARQNVETWFDSGMDRVSGWYKRQTQAILFAIALVITVAVNANSLVIAEQLYRNGDTRKEVVAAAVARTASPLATQQDSALTAAVNEIANLELPLGWPVMVTTSKRFTSPLGMAAGWLLTAFAITLGAPFWFDVLNKIMVIRATVKPHEKSREEGSEDRQTRESTLSALSALSGLTAAPAPAAVVLPATATVPVGTPTSLVGTPETATAATAATAAAPETGAGAG